MGYEDLETLRRIPRLRQRIRDAERRLEEITLVGSVDSSAGPGGGSLPGSPTETLALQRGEITDDLNRLKTELRAALNQAGIITAGLTSREAASIQARYTDGDRVPLALRIEKAYGRRVSRATFYRDLDNAEAHIKNV